MCFIDGNRFGSLMKAQCLVSLDWEFSVVNCSFADWKRIQYPAMLLQITLSW